MHVIKRLKSSELGCRCIIQLWSELLASLERPGGYWIAPERFRAFWLLGLHPVTAYMTSELAHILQACRVLDPDAGSLVGEVWNDLVPADSLKSLEWMYQREIGRAPAMDQKAAREYLLEIVERETTFFEEEAAHEQEKRSKREAEMGVAAAAGSKIAARSRDGGATWPLPKDCFCGTAMPWNRGDPKRPGAGRPRISVIIIGRRRRGSRTWRKVVARLVLRML